MKVAISNIAWELEEEAAAARALAARSLRGVEVAPTKIWPAPLAAPPETLDTYRRFWNEQGIGIVSLQALLFGQPELLIFRDPETRRRTVEYLRGIIALAARLGARILVFGSPANRRVNGLGPTRALAIALDFFREVGECAQSHDTAFCIEPNPPAYGCDFIRTAAEGSELVRAVGHPGFRLHLDVSAMTLNGEDYERAIEESFDCLEHFHVSEPHLAMVGETSTDHGRVARCLRRLGYKGWVSIEMRSRPGTSNIPAVESALDFVLGTYRA
jgi:sugar phosphate isomerase/epimerase